MTARKYRGSWYVDFRYSHKRIRLKSPIQNKRGAEEYERMLRQRLLEGKSLEGNEKKEVLFKEFAKKWIDLYPSIAGNKPSEIASKRSILNNHLIPEFGKLTLQQISPKTIDSFTAKLLKEGRQKKTVHNILGVLSRCLRSAVEWEELEKLPHIRKPSVPLPEFDWLKRDESERLLNSARDEFDHICLQFALYTGCRAGEQLALKWKNIDFDRKKVLIREAVWQGKEGLPKSNRTREVQLSHRLEKSLRQYRHLRGPYVFCNNDGSPLTINQLEYVLKRTIPRAGLRKVTWHCLRHSFASQLVSAGISLRVVQELLGHADIRTTMRYAHLAPGLCRDAVSIFDDEKSGHHLGTEKFEAAEKDTFREVARGKKELKSLKK